VTRHVFVITMSGELDQSLRDEFADAEIAVDLGVTRLRLDSADAGVLHGVLNRIDALGLELLGVHQDDAGPEH
jgi:hypothetical protein